MFFHRHGGKRAIAEPDDKCDCQKPSCFITFLYDVLGIELDANAIGSVGGRLELEFQQGGSGDVWDVHGWDHDTWICAGFLVTRPRLDCNHDISKSIYLYTLKVTVSVPICLYRYIYKFTTWMLFTLGVLGQLEALHTKQ